MSPADQYDTLVDGTVFVYLGLVIVESLNRPNIVEDLWWNLLEFRLFSQVLPVERWGMSAQETRYDRESKKATKEHCDEYRAEEGEVGEANQDVDDGFDRSVETVLHHIRDHINIIILSAN